MVQGDKIVSAIPDFSGRIWFVTVTGVVGTVDPATGTVRSHATGEEIANSFGVDETGAVYVVTKTALYRFDARADGSPAVTWREQYRNSGITKPGQVDAGSGTTPTVMAGGRVAITDNADPMNVVVYRKAARVTGRRLICEQPVFAKGASATDNSLIAARDSLIVENNYGYTGPTSTMTATPPRPGSSGWTCSSATGAAARSGAAPRRPRPWCPSSPWRPAWSTPTPSPPAATTSTPGTSRR